MGKSATIQNIYPLTPMQQGMLFNYLYNKDSKAYFQQFCFSLEADLDIDIFEKSFNKVIEGYDVFRSIFIYEKVEEPKQIVLAERTARLYYEDISQMTVKEKVYYLDEFKKKDKEKGFDISKDMLMRISIIRLAAKEYQIVWSHHHIIMDGWSLGLVLQDFISIYKSLKSGEELKLVKSYQYVDYINWLAKQDKGYAEQYWKNCLENYDNETSIQQKVKAKIYEYDKKEIHFTIDKELTAKIIDICRKNNVTINNAFQAIWAVLLQKYNNTDDIVFGAVVSGRNAPIDGIEKMIGLFINTIPIRVKCDGNLSFNSLLENIRDNYNNSVKYDFMSLAQIQNTCNLKQNLISNIFIFENYPANDILNKANNNFKVKDIQSFEQTNYDFNIVIIPSDEIHIKLKYNSLVYDDKAVEAVKNHILEIINCICSNSEVCLKDIKMLTDNEYSQLVYKFNQNKMDYPINAVINELFEEQAVKTPGNAAVVYKDHTITYKELNEKANSVARVLRNMGVKSNTVVALVTERSIEMIIGILAVLKAGGAYLPIDPQYPRERVNYMLKDSNAKLLIINTDIKDISFKGNVIDLRNNFIYSYDKSNLENINLSRDLAYIVYTSGTTGKPKGVMIENRSVINLSVNLYKKIYQKYKFELNVALLSPYAFDASVKQIFPCILFGQTLVIIPEEERLNGEKLANYYIDHHIDISDGTPAHLSIIQDMLLDKSIKFPTKQFIIGGEELSIELVRNFFNLYENKNLKISNVYGPTECCDVSTMYQIDKENLASLSKIPIGKNLGNVQIYILDKYLNPMPFDTPGEIYISGDGLSRGYLNHQELTEDRFIINPFIEGVKMYRTGDLGKRLINGDIEYLGRIDHQVKIRGMRIELGEIEKQILSYAGVKEAVSVCEESSQGSKYIAAFLIANGNLNLIDLRKHLSKNLPAYMIPAYIMEIDKMPVTYNGKLDKNKLIEKIKFEQVQYAAPRNNIEKELIKIWENVLGISKIGIYDDFFELGGDSLKAIKILSKANNLKIPVSVKAILEYRTVERIMDNCYMNNGIEVNSEAAACLQRNSYDLEKERIYNKSFKVTTEYPSYFGCMAGVILEKLKHEKNIYLERSFLPVGGGKFFLTYGHVNDRGLKNKLQYRELPTEMNPDVINIFDKLGVKEEVKSFKDLETGLDYCKEHLRKNELVMISGTTYYLNYTPDYCMGEEKWKRRLDIRPENIIAVSNKSSGRAHTFLLVDIIKDGYLVYDTTFNYFGVIPKEDFNRSFAGLRGMSFLDGMYAQTTNLPYAVTELDLSKLTEVNNEQLALEILKNNIDINLSNRRIDFKSNGYEFTFYIGVRAYKEIAGMLKEYRNNNTYFDDLKKLVQSSFGSWKYKFIFFQEFLDALSKYIELPKAYMNYCNGFIKACTIISSQTEGINSVNIDDFITDICSKLENIYEQQVLMLNNLKSLLS